MPTPESAEPSPPAPPRAFTQGVGTVFQFTGVTLFLLSMFVCCGSSLLGKEATHTNLTRVGWHAAGDAPAAPSYSAQRAITISVPVAVFLGMALAGLGLGLQAQNRWSPPMSVFVNGFGVAFWLVQAIFFAQAARSIMLTILCVVLLLIFIGMLALSIGALREMRRDPPPIGHEILPADFKVPYSHMHDDPPEIRLGRELEQRRERLAVQQKELELLEEKLKRKLQQKDEPPV